ncbi:MAG TPA: NUDIX hydrolase [Candidatus Microsaccharimonas sp.]
MHQPTVIGTPDSSIRYIDRPTVKALVLNAKNEVLIINNGLLPGGGIEDNEDDATALRREIIEELGMTVSNINSLETIIQYRNFLNKKYVINGYTVRYEGNLVNTSPQDEGEAQFTYAWYSIEDAKKLLNKSISQIEATKPVLDDTYQGKIFNLRTTRVLLDSYAKSS